MIVMTGWNLPLVEAARATWPAMNWPHWHKYDDANERKYSTKDPSRVTPPVAELIRLMAVLPVDDGWFPDMDLYGAGMHWISTGGHLGRHVDSSVHPLTGWFRKCNAILFLDECAGGELEIDGFEPIVPKPGKLVMFSSNVWHSVRQITGGERRTVSLFWWSTRGTGSNERAVFEKT